MRPKTKAKYGLCQDPRVTADALEAMIEYLAHLKASAKNAAASAAAAHKISGEEMFAMSKAYWLNVASGLQWSIGRLRQSQRYTHERNGKAN